MTTTGNLELKGIIRLYPLGELIMEITEAKLCGSLRLASDDKKVVLYFDDGKLVFVVSNQRVFRLAETLLEQNILEPEFFAKNRNVSNDIQLLELISSSGQVSPANLRMLVRGQCESIVASALEWTEGEWEFSPFSRLKAGVAYEIEHQKLLFRYCHSLPAEAAQARFHSMDETFLLRPEGRNGLELAPHEAFLLSRFDSSPLELRHILTLSGLEANVAMHALYTIWMAGLVIRQQWARAFSEKKISAILSAGLTVKQSATPQPVLKPKKSPETEPEPVAVEQEPIAASEVEYDLEDCLLQIEAAENYYQVLGVEPSAKIANIRQAYFRLAKLIHPDRYH